jgi:hypothetical protein
VTKPTVDTKRKKRNNRTSRLDRYTRNAVLVVLLSLSLPARKPIDFVVDSLRQHSFRQLHSSHYHVVLPLFFIVAHTHIIRIYYEVHHHLLQTVHSYRTYLRYGTGTRRYSRIIYLSRLSTCYFRSFHLVV